MPVNIPISTENTGDVNEKLSGTASQLKSKVSNLGQTTAEKIDESRSAAASGLENAAAALHEKAGSLPGGEKVSGLAHNAAEKLSSTAEYVRRQDVNGMMADMKRAVTENPLRSLLMAAAIGFFVGRTFSGGD